MIHANPSGDEPRIHESAFIHPSAVIIGRVRIGRKVFVGPGAVIRADEPGSSITIGDHCNIQDRVIIHALQKTSVKIGNNSSLSHGCIVHGPCVIGKKCFIGFGAVVFDARLGDGTAIKHLAVVEKVALGPGRLVEALQSVNPKKPAGKLAQTDQETNDFVARVLAVNKKLVKGYTGRGKARVKP